MEYGDKGWEKQMISLSLYLSDTHILFIFVHNHFEPGYI